MTDNPQVLVFAEQAFDGDMLLDAGTYFSLQGFQSNVTSMAAVSAPDGGGLFLAVSSPQQVAVYPVPCL
jgi:hypothetical protein